MCRPCQRMRFVVGGGGATANVGMIFLQALFPLTAIPRRIHRISSDLRS